MCPSSKGSSNFILLFESMLLTVCLFVERVLVLALLFRGSHLSASWFSFVGGLVPLLVDELNVSLVPGSKMVPLLHVLL